MDWKGFFNILLMLSKDLERSRPLSLVELASTENDPRPGPLAVMSVMTADADAVDIDPPKIRAAISDFVCMFILFSMKGYWSRARVVLVVAQQRLLISPISCTIIHI